MQDVHILRVRCQSPNISQTKRYCLKIVGESSTLVGIANAQSDYAKCQTDGIAWEEPFGGSFSFRPTDATPTLKFTLSLKKHRHIVRDEILGTCSVDLRSGASSSEDFAVAFVNDREATIGTCHVTIDVSSTSPSAHTRLVGDRLVQVPLTHMPSMPSVPTADHFEAWDSLRKSLVRLSGAVQVLDKLATIHPWVQLAWGIVSVAYKVVKAQSDRDANVFDLVQAMTRSCDYACDAEGLAKGSPRHQVLLRKTLEQVVECAYFIRDYTNDATFVARLQKYLITWTIDDQIAQYLQSFKDLEAEATSNSVLRIHLIVDSIKKTVQSHYDYSILSDMEYTSDAQPDIEDVCLPGTRTEVIDAIMQWASGADGMLTGSRVASDDASGDPRRKFISRCNDQSSRVLWVCGVAGTGKSAIWRTIASRLDETKRLGARYAFSASRAATKPSNLFATIARKLADRDHILKRRLVDDIKDNTDLRETKNCVKQFKSFIVEPTTDLPTIGETFILIDAFDESAPLDDRNRKDVLDMLTREAHTLPRGIRVIITSRKEPDVVQALQSPLDAVDVLFMDDVPAELTARDIASFVNDCLRSTTGLRQDRIDALIKKAGSSFQWAFTACQFVTKSEGGTIPGERLEEILRTDDLNLDQLYAKVLGVYFNPHNPKALERLRRILGCIMSAQEPLASKVLTVLIPKSPDHSPYNSPIVLLSNTLPYLSSLLSGTHNEDTGISPLHPSFREYICDAKRSDPFTIIIETSHLLMARGCLYVMERELCFNICRLPTSYKANREIENIDALVKRYISPPLLYACKYWAYHASYVLTWSDELAQEVATFFQSRFLWWLEVMSVTQASFLDALALLDNSKTHGIPTDLIQDARRFASTFAISIIRSAPHIYLSALLFAPESSSIHRSHGVHYRATASVVRGRLKTWPTLLRILEGHSLGSGNLTLASDGLHLISGSSDGIIRSWDSKTGGSIGEPLHIHAQPVAHSVDGKLILSYSMAFPSVTVANHFLHLRDATHGGTILRTFHGLTDWLKDADLSRDGTRIVASSHDGVIRLWNTQTEEVIYTESHRRLYGPPIVAFSPDGTRFVSGLPSGILCLHNASNGQKQVDPWSGHAGSITAVALSPDGQCLLSASYDGTICLWELEMSNITGQKLHCPLEDSHVTCAIFSPNGSHILAGSHRGNLYLWNGPTGDLIHAWSSGHGTGIDSVTFLSGGTEFISSSKSPNSALHWWNIGLSLSPDIASEPRAVHKSAVTSVAFSPNGRTVLSASRDKTIRLWDPATGGPVGHPFFLPAVPTLASFSFDGALVIALYLNSSCSWDTRTGQLVGHYGIAGYIHLTPKRVLTADKSQVVTFESRKLGVTIEDISIRDRRRPRKVKKLPMLVFSETPSDIVNVFTGAISPDGATLLLVFANQHLHQMCLCSTETGERVSDFWTDHDEGSIYWVTFSPDGTRVASLGHSPRCVMIWDVETGRVIDRPFIGCDSEAVYVAFAPDSKRIACTFSNLTISLWDTESKRALGVPMAGHDLPNFTLDFSLDGQRLVSGSYDQTLRIWDIRRMLQAIQPSFDTEKKPDAKTPSPPPLYDAAQYPDNLFPSGTFAMHDGWIWGPEGELILWVPPVHRRGLYYPISRPIGAAHPTELDFSRYVGGEQWTECYTPGFDSCEVAPESS